MRLTIEDLVARSLQSDLDKYKTVPIVIDDEGNYIMAEKRNLKIVSRLVDDDCLSAEENMEKTAMLIYEHCKILHSEELRRNYGVTEPFDVVEKVFMSNVELIQQAGHKILTMYGMDREKTEKEENTVDAVEAVKN